MSRTNNSGGLYTNEGNLFVSYLRDANSMRHTT